MIEQQRGSSASRGYNARWRQIRERFLFDHPLCRDPFGIHKGIPIEATDVDHITPRRKGGPDTEDNLQPLCHACHSRKTMLELQGRGDTISATSKTKTAPNLCVDSREMGAGGLKEGEGGENGR